jgi:medium-chain acyl-[acyl-carrier-protein] hydrolase
MEVSAYNETFDLPAAAGDNTELARLLELLDAMQETAGRHAAMLSVGVRDLHAKGLTWVLARMHVQVNSTRIITDSTGTVVYSALFDPHGGMQK